jgi:type VI secretion system protein ImpC
MASKEILQNMSSIHKSLLRIRDPRVKIEYEVEVGDAIVKQELPFLMGVLADLAGENGKNLDPIKERSFIEIDRDNFDAVLRAISPSITVAARNTFSTEEKTERYALNFRKFEDFEPGKIARQIPALNELLNNRSGLVDLLSKLDGNEVLAKRINAIVAKKEDRESLQSDLNNPEFPYIRGILDEAKMIKEDSNLEFLRGLFRALSSTLENVSLTLIKDEYSFLMRLISEIDINLSKQMDEIIHDKNFQKLEATWRSLNFLVFKSETSTRLKLRVLPISKDEIAADLSKAVEFDQSALFKKIYEAEYGTLGGTPYSCLIGDFSFGKSATDVKLIRNIATVAAAAHAPFIAAAHPSLFDMDSFENLATPRDLAKIFESSELTAWNSFRETEDARYVNLTLPKVLTRLPFSVENNPCAEFGYNETVEGENNDKFCWGNPAFVLGQRITEAFALYSWTAAIRGAEGGGKVDQLPMHTFKTSKGDIELKCPCETPITDRREKELSELGFISLCHAKGTDYSVFFGAQSVQKAQKFNTASATANSLISARLPYLLNASRFAHYVKILIRDKIGSFMSAKEVEMYLQNWIADYVLLSDDGPQSLKAQYPLREAKITVVDSPESPGSYKAVMFLRPHFQLEELSVSMRLVANLSSGG